MLERTNQERSNLAKSLKPLLHKHYNLYIFDDMMPNWSAQVLPFSGSLLSEYHPPNVPTVTKFISCHVICNRLPPDRCRRVAHHRVLNNIAPTEQKGTVKVAPVRCSTTAAMANVDDVRVLLSLQLRLDELRERQRGILPWAVACSGSSSEATTTSPWPSHLLILCFGCVV